MKKLKYLIYALTLIFLLPAGCDEDEPNTLSVSPTSINLSKDGGSATVTILTDAGSWSISNPASDWLNLSSTSGTGNNASVTLTVDTRTLTPRSATLVVTAGSAKPVEIIVSQPPSSSLYSLEADLSTITFEKSGGSKTLEITTDATQWNLDNAIDWLDVSATTGNAGNTTITLTASENTGDDAREGTITVTASEASPLTITIKQKGSLYPNYNTSPLAPDATGMSSDAVTLAAKMNLGWNIGNTLEAIGGETAWGNPLVSEALIDLVKQNGFNAIRIPCSWNQHMANSTTAQIKTDWLNRVKQVVQYCVDRDMYVLLNIHWDGGWLENNCTPEKQEENNAKQKAFWEQIATHLRDFDEHLLFASANEPNVENATQMAVLNSYHQTFINAVRSTGGRNSYRVLVVQGPSTDIEKTNTLVTSLPTDEIEDRLMMEIHFYTPYQFCLMESDAEWGKMFYFWGEDYHSPTNTERNATWGEESTIDNLMGMMKQKFVDNGIPVVLGEYAVARRTTLTGDDLTRHLESRAYWLKYVTQAAKANGLIPFYWDAGSMGNFGSALFKRSDNTVFDQQALDALLEGTAD